MPTQKQKDGERDLRLPEHSNTKESCLLIFGSMFKGVRSRLVSDY